MTATNKTAHYDLSQFVGTDQPTWLGDYNGDMKKIDAQMKQNADAIEQATAGGLTSVSHTDDLTGDGTSGSPLGVAATIARTTDIPSLDGYATTESVTQAIAAAIADRLTAGNIKPGNGINIETSGNTVTISYVGGGSSGGLAAVAHDATLTGDGTKAMPLRLAIGSALNQGVTVSTINLDFDTYVSSGIYGITSDASGAVENSPSEMEGKNIRGVLLVSQCGYESGNREVVLQTLFTRNLDRKDLGIHMRGLRSGTWDKWRSFAAMDKIPNVSALTSRIATLESQVAMLTAAATPSATGLTAKQLDSRYSDGYNIVRVGTPTHNTESEEPSQ